MREFIEILEKNRMLERKSSEIDVMYGITEHLKNTEKSLFFENVKGYPGFSVVANLLSDRKRISLALGCAEDGILEKINNAIENLVRTKKSEACAENAPFLETEISLDDIPIPTYFRTDGGPYITSAVVIAKDPEYGHNVSFHRMMKKGKNLVIRIVNRHLWEFYERSGRSLDIAICIGAEPAVLLAGAINTKIGISELEIAGALKGAALDVVEINGIEVPAKCEIVIEARITEIMSDEGPFVDITRTPDFVRKQPVVEIKKIHTRKNTVFHALLPGGHEHGELWKASTEAVIYNAVNKVCACTDVFLSHGGCSRLHGIVKIKKKCQDDGMAAIKAAFGAHKSMKHVFIVDDDIDIRNPNDVEWAMATRFQAKNDIVAMHDVKGSTLDPSSNDGMMSKLGFDCTIKGDRKKFEKVF